MQEADVLIFFSSLELQLLNYIGNDMSVAETHGTTYLGLNLSISVLCILCLFLLLIELSFFRFLTIFPKLFGCV